MTSRRTFLKALLALPIAAQYDFEKLLWVPQTMITVPAMPRMGAGISLDQINAILVHHAEQIYRVFDRDESLVRLYDKLERGYRR